MARRFTGVLAILIVALLFSSCSGSRTQNTKAASSPTSSAALQSTDGSVPTLPPTTTTTNAPLPPSTTSTVQVPAPPPTIEGFPLPPKAVLISGPAEKKSPYTGFVSTQATYSAPDMSSSELRSWYERNPIYRAAFGQYQWCESFVDGGNWDMWWRNSATKTALGVNSLTSNANTKGVTFSVSRETGDNTACR